MLDYVVTLTKDATKCSREDHDRLREVGFDDRAILQITLIASWFNYINRVADALGVGRDLPKTVALAGASKAETQSILPRQNYSNLFSVLS